MVTHAYTFVVQRTKFTRKLSTASTANHYFQHFSTPVTTLEAVSFHKIKHVGHKILYMYSTVVLLNPGSQIFWATKSAVQHLTF